MSAYTAASAVGWLDLDSAASERVADLLRALEEPGTLDPIGLGSVRDAFSTMLSPGTSTNHTRLRYFVFLPWIFAQLEAQRVTPGDFARRLHDSEARLIDCLHHLGPSHGVIGYNAGRKLRRMPSDVYWGGLGSWGLRRLDLSRAEYAKRAAALGRLRPDRDDDGNVTTASITMWAPMTTPPENFLSAHIDFNLTRDEAQLLVDHIRQRHPGSLLAALCDAPQAAAAADLPWDVLDTTALPEQLRDALRHAQCFSELTAGPQHVYNILLAEQASADLGWDTADLEARQRGRLADWAERIADPRRYGELRAWVDDLPGFWAFLARFDAISDRTQTFVETMVTQAIEDPAGFADDPTVRTTIRTREIQLKQQRARLGSRSALESWNQAPFGEQLNYRWPVTKSYLADIAAAMAQGA